MKIAYVLLFVLATGCYAQNWRTGGLTKGFKNIDTTSKPPIPPDTTHYLDVILTGGQSNADGRAMSPYPPYTQIGCCQMKVPNVNVWDWVNNKFVTFDFNIMNGGYTYGTPQWAFDIIVAQMWRDSIPGAAPIYFIKATKGGTAFDPNQTAGCWQYPSDSSNVPIKMYDTLYKHLNDAKAWATAQGKVLRVKAFLWHQGESDAYPYVASNVSNYGTRLLRLFTQVRVLCSNSNLPIIMGTIPYASIAYRSDMETFMLNLPLQDPNIHVVNLHDAALVDEYHMGSDWQTIFGQRTFQILKPFL